MVNPYYCLLIDTLVHWWFVEYWILKVLWLFAQMFLCTCIPAKNAYMLSFYRQAPYLLFNNISNNVILIGRCELGPSGQHSSRRRAGGRERKVVAIGCYCRAEVLEAVVHQDVRICTGENLKALDIWYFGRHTVFPGVALIICLLIEEDWMIVR